MGTSCLYRLQIKKNRRCQKLYFFNKACGVFQECRTDFLCEFVHVAWHRLTSLRLWISLLEMFQKRQIISVMNLRSPGPVAGQPISVKVKCRIPFSEPIQRSVRGNLVHFKTKWRPKIQFSCILSRVFIVAMLQHRPPKTSKQIEMNL